jgi:2-C-methyl-D-erythritol 4-phosphate cytidylyltransferase / 2-C-methyl-D-erythritol 2,4-cyclodiphosphate synthase
MATTVAVIVAGGRGERLRGPSDIPKQYLPLAGAPVLAHSLRVLAGHPQVGRTQVVIHPTDRDRYEEAAGPFAAHLAGPVGGGSTRQESVRRGLEALEVLAPERVLIHDAARPFLTAGLVTRLLAALDSHRGAIAAEPIADTLKRATADGLVADTIERANLWRAQTPQAFHFADILAAHRRAAAAGKDGFTDDSALAEWAGLPVQLVASSGNNMKLTTREDFMLAERLLGGAPALLEPRNGSGFDVHAFAPGDNVWLCGVRVPHTQRLDGNSDADVALHALTDAILGATGDGDIGEHFPPSDEAWRGAPSRLFVEDALRRVRALGGRIGNVDVTILCEAPKIGPHRTEMRRTIADMLQIDPGRVGVKATTMEGLGFVGRREGIAALASALILLPV